MTTAEAKPEAQAGQPAAPEDTQPTELAVRRLAGVVLYGKPWQAIAAFRSLTVLYQFYKETFARIIELSRTGRPAVAGAAARALVEGKLAHRRWRNGRSPLLRL